MNNPGRIHFYKFNTMRIKSYSIKSILFIWLLIMFSCNVLWAQNETSKTSVKKFTILYTNDSHPENIDSATISLFTRNIINNFPGLTNMELFKWKNKDSFYMKSEQEIFNSMHLDAFYNLKYSIKLNELSSVTPELVIKNNNDGSIRTIVLPVYSVDYYENYNFTQFLVEELSGFLKSYFYINNSDSEEFLLDSYTWNTLFPMAKLSSSKEDYSKSNFYLNLLIEKKSDLHDTAKVQIYYLLGNNKINDYRIDEAEEEYNKALVIDPKYYWANFGIAKVLFAEGNFEGALRKADALLPATSEVYLLKGQAYMGLKQFDDAERNFKNISSKSNEEVSNSKLLFLGSIYIETNENDKAYDIYKELYLLDTSNSNIAYLYGYLVSLKGFNEFKNKNFAGAVDLLLAANQVYNSTDVTDYLRLAFINERRFDEALELIAQKIQEGEYSPDDIYLTHALDIRDIFIDDTPSRYENIDEFGEQVLKAIDLHLNFNPNDPNGYFYKGNTLTRMGKDIQGLEQMEIAYEKDISNQSVQLDLMELYLINSKLDKADSFYNKVSQNNKTNKIEVKDREQALMNYLLITSLKLQDKKTKKAQKRLTKLWKSGVIIDRWSYNTYLTWLEKSNYNEASKSFLVELTDEMKSHDYKG